MFCWLISADSSGAVVYLDLSPAAAVVASAASAAVLPLTPIPQLIRSLDLASKLQALPGHASTHAACCASHTPQRYRCTPHVILSSSSSSSSQTNVESRCQKGKGDMKSMLFYLLHFDGVSAGSFAQLGPLLAGNRPAPTLIKLFFGFGQTSKTSLCISLLHLRLQLYVHLMSFRSLMHA